MENRKQNVLITGATSGIGLELAKLFARDGYSLIIVARSQTDLDNTARQLISANGTQVLTIAKDLFEPNAAFELYSEIKAKDLKIDILVNDAGQGVYGKFAEVDINRSLAIVQLNICSLIALTHQCLQEMIARGTGRILNLSSIASKTPGPWQSVYHGTKAFVQSFTEAIRTEVKDSGVVVTALLPGVTDTDFFNKADMLSSKAVQDKDAMANPADVARDGYEALMAGDDKIISGFKNKAQVTMSNMMSDSAVAGHIYEQQAPVDKNN